jgi:hypothetical protein
MKKSEFGVFEVVLPPKDGQPAIPHNSKIKVKTKPSPFRLHIHELTGFHRSALNSLPENGLTDFRPGSNM